MFEKLKEYWLYIILWLIALWALAYAYVHTQNSQKWAEIESANFDAMTTALSRSDKLKKSSTVANDLLQANWWRTIWKYKIDDSKVSYVIWETYSDIFENKKTLDVLSNLSDIEEWQLRTILIAQPAVEVEWNESEVIVWLNSDKSIEIWWWTISQEDVKDTADELKWYNVSAIWYTTFETEQEAKDFRDSYFSSYEIYEIWNTWKYMILTQYNTTTWWEIDSTTTSPVPTSLSNSWNVEIQTTYSWIQNNLRALLAEATALLADEYFDNHETEYNQFIARANAINANIDSINEENKNDKNTEITALINTLKSDILEILPCPNTDQERNSSWICEDVLYVASNWITIKAKDFAIWWKEYTLNWVSYYVASSKWDIESKLFTNYQKTERREWSDASKIITTKVTDMSSLFARSRSSDKTFNDDISTWDTSNVTTMERMFLWNYLFNQDISHWDTSNVTNMNYMFHAWRSAYWAFNQPIWSWDVSHVTSMSQMFYNQANFNQNIWSWNVSNVTTMWWMFECAWFDNWWSDSIRNWNTWNVTDMSNMFWCWQLEKSIFNQPINNWDVSHVTNMNGMFARNWNFNQPLNNWNTSSLTTMWTMFYRTWFNQDISMWNTTNITNYNRFDWANMWWWQASKKPIFQS